MLGEKHGWVTFSLTMIVLAHPNNQNIFVLPTHLRVNIDRPNEGWGNFSVGPQCQLQLQSWDSTLGPNFKLLLFEHRNQRERIFTHYYTLQLCPCEAQNSRTPLLKRVISNWVLQYCSQNVPECKLLPIYSFTEPRLGFSQVAYVLDLRWSMRIQFDAPGYGTAHNNQEECSLLYIRNSRRCIGT